MKKKIGLAVVTYVRNYGSYLQSFATQETIKSLGYDTEVINIKGVSKIISQARRKYFLKRMFNISELKSYAVTLYGIARMKFDREYAGNIRIRDRKYDEFRGKFSFSKEISSWEGIGKYCKDNYSSVVVGSDQLWRPANIEGDYYTLNFVPEEVNKIAYSTSFGVSMLPKAQADKAKNFIPRINHISVREEKGKDLVKQLTGLDVPVVCDPTMLLTREEWEKYLPKTSDWFGRKYILCYFLGGNEQYLKFAKKMKKYMSLPLVGLVHCSGYNPNVNLYIDEMPFNVGPFDFIDIIRNASCVLTDSFHCCVFSILFQKDFFAFRRFADTDVMSTNDRLNTLFSWADIKGRLLRGDEEINKELLVSIDYQHVDEKLSEYRRTSKDYLIQSLRDGKKYE